MLKSATEISSILNLSNVYQSSGRSLLAIELLEKTIQTERLSNIQKDILLNNLGNYVWSYKHSNSSKPIPGIFNKIEKPILLQSNCCNLKIAI
jgi:hypothetical protein